MAKCSLTQTDGVGLLLAQLGHHAATLFADQMATIELSLTQVGILRAVAATPGRSQHDLGATWACCPVVSSPTSTSSSSRGMSSAAATPVTAAETPYT